MNRFFRTDYLAMILSLALPILSGCSAGTSSTPAGGENRPEPVEETSRFDPSLSDPKAIEIARSTYESIGGDEGFENAALISFRFVVEKDGTPISDYGHVWDRKTGRYRLSGTQKDGKGIIAFFNVSDFSVDKPGQDVYISGRRLDDFESSNHLKWMYGRFINDTYWLLMPAKLRDPGVILKYEGESTDSTGQIHDIILASFQEGTGITWQDRYWVYINRETHLMDRWEYIHFESSNHLKWMYGRFINDTYWLLMPAKLRDPGVILKYEGESTDSTGQIHDIILASFQEGTGITWQDRYWVYINRETHLMDRWEYILMGSPEDEPRSVATWTEWAPHGSLVLSTIKDFPGKSFRIRIADLQVSGTVSEDLFKRPTN